MQAWLTLPSCLASSSKPTFPLIIFWSFVIVGVLLKLRARPRLSLRPYDTNCPIKCNLLYINSQAYWENMALAKLQRDDISGAIADLATANAFRGDDLT